MRAEAGAMDDPYALRDRLQRDCPVDRRVTAADDDDVLLAKVVDVLREVMDALAFELPLPRRSDPLRLERPDTRAHDDRLAEPLSHRRRELDDAVFLHVEL